MSQQNQAQIKNQQAQSAIQQQLEYLLLLYQLLGIVFNTVPGFVWIGWGTGKRVDETNEQDLAGLTPSQASAWANAVTVEYTEAGGQ